jgi:hypothetical protein
MGLYQDQLGTKSRILGIYVEHYMVKYKIISPLYEIGCIHLSFVCLFSSSSSSIVMDNAN